MDEQIHKLIKYSKKGILSNVVIKSEKFNITLFCMAEGTDISEHTSTKSGFVYVIEGDGVFNLEGKEIKMSPGVLIQMNEDGVHSLKSTKNTSFILVLTN